MKANKQAQELSAKIAQIEAYYNELLYIFTNCTIEGKSFAELVQTLDKAKAWDIFRAKCAKGAKVASGNLSRKERIDRAKKASQAKAEKAQKACKELNRTKRGKTRTKTEQPA